MELPVIDLLKSMNIKTIADSVYARQLILGKEIKTCTLCKPNQKVM